MLKSVVEQLAAHDAAFVAPRKVRQTIQKGILLGEEGVSKVLDSIAHRLVASRGVAKTTLIHMKKSFAIMEQLGGPKNPKIKKTWLLLGGKAGKKWLEKVLP